MLRNRLGTHWELDENNQNSTSPPFPQRKKPSPLGASCLTSLVARIYFAYLVFFVIFGLRVIAGA
jgi:hypothetical protein